MEMYTPEYKNTHKGGLSMAYLPHPIVWGLVLCFTTVLSNRLALADGTGETFNTSKTIGDLISKNDPRVRPNAEGGPVNVSCGIYVVSFGSVSEINMEYVVTLYLRTAWNDPRMRHNLNKSLSLSHKVVQQVWVPDVFFPNEKQATHHIVPTPNTLMKVEPNGSVIYSLRLTLKLACPMDLHAFPMDHQDCELKLESFGLDTSNMLLHWLPNEPIEVNDNVELPQFDLVDWTSGECKVVYAKTGEFPCLEARFELQRQFGYFLLQTYVPTILIVVLSWVSFWINMDAVPARISLGVTTVLTMTTQLTGSKGSIPRVSYPKAIDVWMSVCMIFVFTALLEYAFVNALSRKYRSKSMRLKLKERKQNKEVKDGLSDEEDIPRGMQMLNVRRLMGTRQVARLLDKLSRLLFPLTFGIFNLIYWPLYLKHKIN